MFGQEFSENLAYCDWKQGNTTFPMLRVALACCQVTSPKASQKDGFAKLITKSDFDKLKGKKTMQKLLVAEALMLAAWESIQKSGLPLEKMALPFGKFQVRLTLFLLDKELKGREEKKYEDMDKIKEMFENDLAACAVQQAMPSTSSPSTSVATVEVKALALASDPKSIALSQHKHIKEAGLYVYKGGAKVFRLKEMKEDAASLFHEPYFGKKEVLEVKLADLKHLKEWKKAEPALIADDVREELLPTKSKMLEQELATAQAQCALYEKYKEFLGCSTPFEFVDMVRKSSLNLFPLFHFCSKNWQHRLGDFPVLVSNQHEIFAGAKFPKGKLQLLPMGSLQLALLAKAPKGACIIKSKDLSDSGYIVQPWKCDFTKKTGMFCPYWMVKEGEDKDDSCLVESTLKIGNLFIPCFTNKKAIEKGTPLALEPAEEAKSSKKKKTQQK